MPVPPNRLIYHDNERNATYHFYNGPSCVAVVIRLLCDHDQPCMLSCMQAVNQCIGRVIRHRQDWAAVVLADARWATHAGAGPRQKLPAWIQKSLLVSSGFGDAYSRLMAFGRRMQTQGFENGQLETKKESKP